MAAAALTLLYPAIPMMFMGEEIASESPFLFFADFQDEGLRKAVDRGRKHEFPDADWTDAVMPSDERAFYDSKITLPDSPNRMKSWYQQLLQIRKQWLADGLLNPDQMEIKSSVESNLFCINYKTTAQSVFVVARFGTPGADQSPITLTLDGTILLDSEGGATNGDIEIKTNRALVGTGKVTWKE